MTPLRFRAWHVEQQKMYSPEEMGGDELTLAVDGRGLVNVSGQSTRLSVYLGNRMVVMQSTGLHDKNGKEIWQGDILRIVWKTAITLDEREGSTRHRERRTFVCEVKFGEGQVFGSEWDHDIIGFYLLPTIEHCNLCRDMLEDNEVEVIGNRFEHPHLLPSA